MKFKNGGKLSDYDSSGKKKKAKKKKKLSAKHEGASGANTTSTLSAPSVGMKKREGTGHLMHSGTVVTGQGTLFGRELAVGDALILQVRQKVMK